MPADDPARRSGITTAHRTEEARAQRRRLARSLLLVRIMRNAIAYVPIVEPIPEHGAPVQVEPEIVLPEQFGNLGRRWTRPEHRLMLAVLEDAVHAYQTGCASSGGERRLHFRETAEWFASDDTEWPFSFVIICQHFGIEPEYVRAGLRRWRERHGAGLAGTVRAVPSRIHRMHGSRHRVTSARRWRDEA